MAQVPKSKFQDSKCKLDKQVSIFLVDFSGKHSTLLSSGGMYNVREETEDQL